MKNSKLKSILVLIGVFILFTMCAVLPFVVKSHIDSKNEKKHIHKQSSMAYSEPISFAEQFSYSANSVLNVVSTVTTDSINYSDIKNKIVYVQTKVALTKEEIKADEYCEYAIDNFRVDTNNVNTFKVLETEADGITPLKVTLTFDVKAIKGKNIEYSVYAFTEDEFNKELRQETDYIKANGVYSNTQDKDKIQFIEGPQQLLCNTTIADGTEIHSTDEQAAFTKVLFKLDEHETKIVEKSKKSNFEPKYKSTEFVYEINGAKSTTLVDIANNNSSNDNTGTSGINYWQVIGEVYANVGEEVVYTTMFPAIGDAFEVEEKGAYKVAIE